VNLRLVLIYFLILSMHFCTPAELNNPNDLTSAARIITFLKLTLPSESETRTVTIQGKISGLIPNSNLELLINGSERIPFTSLANGSFTSQFILSSSIQEYSLQISTQPNQLLCSILLGQNGKILGESISEVEIICPIAVVGGLKWYRCSHGQTWSESGNSGAGECTGSGTRVSFCSMDTNDCNGGSDSGLLTSSTSWTGGAISNAWNVCNNLNTSSVNYGLTSWRMPSKEELKSIRYCNNNPSFTGDSNCPTSPNPIVDPTIDSNLFPNTVSSIYSSGESSTATANKQILFSNGSVPGGSKSGINYIRCMSN
jgi:hypothetical protein